MRKTILIAAAFTACIMACKKNDDNPTSALINSWKHTKQVTVETINNVVVHKDSTDYSASSIYWDFRTDNKIYYKKLVNSSYVYDTTSYSNNGNTLSLFLKTGDTLNFSIITLTTSSLTLYSKKNTVEDWLYFSK